MTTERIRVAAVVPTVGRTESLEALLTTIAAQTVPADEVIVVDQNRDGMLDALLPEWVTHLRLEEPNAAAARNAGFLASRSSHVLFVDDDELLGRDHIERVRTTLAAHPTVRCLWPVVHAGDRVRASRLWRRRATGEAIDGSTLFRIAWAGAGGIVFERGLFAELGGYDDVLFRFGGMSEDWELGLRMKRAAAAVWCDSSLFVRHDPVYDGGCATRTMPYWSARERVVRASVFALRIGNPGTLRLRLRDLFPIVRAAFLSSLGRPGARGQVVRHPLAHLRLVADAIDESRSFIRENLVRYVEGGRHLQHAPPAWTVGRSELVEEAAWEAADRSP